MILISGKTYTMEGAAGNDKGVIPRVAEQVVKYIEQYRPKKDDDFTIFTVTGSYLEVNSF